MPSIKRMTPESEAMISVMSALGEKKRRGGWRGRLQSQEGEADAVQIKQILFTLLPRLSLIHLSEGWGGGEAMKESCYST